MIDVASVPDWLENTVGKTKCQNFQYRLLADIKVNAVDMDLTDDFLQFQV